MWTFSGNQLGPFLKNIVKFTSTRTCGEVDTFVSRYFCRFVCSFGIKELGKCGGMFR